MIIEIYMQRENFSDKRSIWVLAKSVYNLTKTWWD